MSFEKQVQEWVNVDNQIKTLGNKMKELKLDNAIEIRLAIDKGYKVYCGNPMYEVIKDRIGQYLIVCKTGYCVGLTWKDGTTLNGEDFYAVVQDEEFYALCRTENQLN